MPQRNVDVVLDQYAATNERDFERVMSHYDDDVELVVREPWLRTGTFRGREAVGGFFGDWLSTFGRDARFDVTEARELENGSVLVVADHHARGRASGVEVRTPVIWVYRLRGGRITHVEGFATREQALEAADPPEWRYLARKAESARSAKRRLGAVNEAHLPEALPDRDARRRGLRRRDRRADDDRQRRDNWAAHLYVYLALMSLGLLLLYLALVGPERFKKRGDES